MEDVVFLAYKDGQAAHHVAQISDDIESQLWLTPPSLVLSPHGIDAHSDHKAVSAAVEQLVHKGKLSCTILEYPMWFWPKGGLKHLMNKSLLSRHCKVRVERFLGLKQQAIDAHQCQKLEANWLALTLYHIAGKLRPYELFFEKPSKPEK